MSAEVAALKLKLNSDSLPLADTDLTFRFAVRVTGLDGLNCVTEFPGEHAKQKHDPLLIHRLVSKSAEVNWITVGWPPVEFGMKGAFVIRRGNLL
jgi:hypothetical protein